ncbi:MAG TPA: 4Fe-4S dicluster domain-containing protein [bacterium]|jgi:ferredoxin
MAKAASKPTRAALDRGNFSHLIEALRKKGFRVIGPQVRDGAIVYDELDDATQLPAGWTDEQSNGQYALKKRPDDALFGYTVPQHSWKQFLRPPHVTVWQGKREGLQPIAPNHDLPSYALLGVRACELRAIAIQDKVLLEGPYVDPGYAAMRKRTFIVALNCGKAGGTCFCASMKTGPEVTGDFDLSLTEIVEKGKHRFVIETGSKRGEEVLKEIPHREATAEDLAAAERVVAEAEKQMGRKLNTDGLREVIYENSEHPRWDNVGSRCLTCGNCTMVCPTCFCTTMEDHTDLHGKTASRVKRWDSCFTLDFSYIHGGSIRTSAKSRYRQWLSHKLAAWQDQFGEMGCTGCGRCITWCPVGIDITEEAAALRVKPAVKEPQHGNA